MAARKARARAPIARARFLKWLSGAVAAANADWRRRRPDLGGEVLGREELLFHPGTYGIRGPHLMGSDDFHYENAEENVEVPIEEDLVSDLIYKAVLEAGLLFAWIDQHQCYGTIAEMGMAIDMHTRVCFSCTPEMYREHWLVFQWVNRFTRSHVSIVANSPAEAWTRFWALHGITGGDRS